LAVGREHRLFELALYEEKRFSATNALEWRSSAVALQTDWGGSIGDGQGANGPYRADLCRDDI
jgi:hypothetical protein